MPRSVLVPITNALAKGDYTARVYVGSRQQKANLILDSGSSAMVVQAEDYDPGQDQALSPTATAQAVTYGMGTWCGPVVKTQVEIGSGLFKVGLKNTHIAVANREQTGCFGLADGILGLAYRELNVARDLTSYLKDNQVEPPVTYPWYLNRDQQDDTLAELKRFLRQFPREDILPYFSQLEQEGVVGNQFAFIIHRSSVYQTNREQPTARLARHPLNNGMLVLGEPKLHQHLYRGQFHKVRVLDNKYYNVRLIRMQVGSNEPRAAPDLAPEQVKSYVSNAIVDSGASMVVVPTELFEQLLADLVLTNDAFEPLLAPFREFEGVEKGIDMDRVNLKEWPDIHFTLEGFDGAEATLTMTPETYWQTHAPTPNQISFQFISLPTWPNQTILGLPLMNNYFTIFDRAEREHGAVLFAGKPFNPHRLADAVHLQLDKLRSLFDHHGLSVPE